MRSSLEEADEADKSQPRDPHGSEAMARNMQAAGTPAPKAAIPDKVSRADVAAASRSSDRSANIARTNDAELKIVSGLGALQDYFGQPGAQVNAQFVSKLQSALDLLGDDWKEFVAASAQRAQGE